MLHCSTICGTATRDNGFVVAVVVVVAVSYLLRILMLHWGTPNTLLFLFQMGNPQSSSRGMQKKKNGTTPKPIGVGTVAQEYDTAAGEKPDSGSLTRHPFVVAVAGCCYYYHLSRNKRMYPWLAGTIAVISPPLDGNTPFLRFLQLNSTVCRYRTE